MVLVFKYLEKSNISSVHKLNDKLLAQTYQPISLWSIFGKIFRKVVFNKIYKFILNERLLNLITLGFVPPILV